MRKTVAPLLVGLYLAVVAPATAQLERCLEAHGGLAKWRSFGALEYDLTYKTPRQERKEHQLFNLQTRSGLITGKNYALGNDGHEVWIKPDLHALGGTPPRFYMGTPFYFFGMPFVFGDPGARHESLGKKRFTDKEYDTVRITFAKGAGDTPDDYYVAYIDPATGRFRMAYYIVTYPALRKGRPIANLSPHAIVFEEWQTVDGLLVPKSASFYKWNGHETEGEPVGRLDFANVHFTTQAPEESKFQKPADAVIAPL
jgi:hypothetical protein